MPSVDFCMLQNLRTKSHAARKNARRTAYSCSYVISNEMWPLISSKMKSIDFLGKYYLKVYHRHTDQKQRLSPNSSMH